ncbi:MAG: glycosyltransferase family 2 protein [Bacteroidaceae bacterium]|nr:glycosyltransferase family 2 protein [Bacteroidaceae bacterium]
MISVIVPIYKVEQYLHRCIDSILSQSYADFELLLIDDGSPDGCGAICDDYAAKDSRVRVFHKENGGVSSARNLGLDNAQGEWITFVDSDDWLESDFLEKLMVDDCTDLVVGGNIRPSGELKQASDRQYDALSIADFLEEHLNGSLLRAPWGKLLRYSIIDSNHIRFDEQIRFGEDTIFIYQYLCQCNIVTTISFCGYHYTDKDDVWWRNARKYKLSLAEIDNSLGQTLALIQRLGDKFATDLDIRPSLIIFIRMFTVFNFSDKDIVLAYKALCQKYIPNLDDLAFYNSQLYSPVILGIVELKRYYQEKNYTEGKTLYPILYCISQVAPKHIPFVYKDFPLWYTLIRHKAYFLCDILLRAYLRLKQLK